MKKRSEALVATKNGHKLLLQPIKWSQAFVATKKREKTVVFFLGGHGFHTVFPQTAFAREEFLLVFSCLLPPCLPSDAPRLMVASRGASVGLPPAVCRAAARLLPAVCRPCWLWKSVRIQWKLVKIDEVWWKSKKIRENPWNPMKITENNEIKFIENQWKSMKSNWKSMKIREETMKIRWKSNENQWKPIKINE